MPQLSELTCVICGEVFKKEELEKYEGLCQGCHEAMNEAEEGVEKREPGEQDIEVSAEMRGAIAAYKKRQAYMAEYNAKPANQAKRKEYMKARNERNKLLLKRAKELGIIE